MASDARRARPFSSHRMTAWCGVSGQSYAFWVFAFDEPLPPAPGLYAYAAASDERGGWRAVYVGAASCFAEDLSGDTVRHEAEALGATHILLHCRGGDGAVRQAAERDLVARLDPPLNREDSANRGEVTAIAVPVSG